MAEKIAAPHMHDKLTSHCLLYFQVLLLFLLNTPGCPPYPDLSSDVSIFEEIGSTFGTLYLPIGTDTSKTLRL